MQRKHIVVQLNAIFQHSPVLYFLLQIQLSKYHKPTPRTNLIELVLITF